MDVQRSRATSSFAVRSGGGECRRSQSATATPAAAPRAPPSVFSRTSSISRLRPSISCSSSTVTESDAQAATAPRRRNRATTGRRNPTGANITTLPTRLSRPRPRLTLFSALRIPDPGTRFTPVPPTPLIIVTARTASSAATRRTRAAASVAAAASRRRSAGSDAAPAARRPTRTARPRLSMGT